MSRKSNIWNDGSALSQLNIKLGNDTFYGIEDFILNAKIGDEHQAINKTTGEKMSAEEFLWKTCVSFVEDYYDEAPEMGPWEEDNET